MAHQKYLQLISWRKICLEVFFKFPSWRQEGAKRGVNKTPPLNCESPVITQHESIIFSWVPLSVQIKFPCWRYSRRCVGRHQHPLRSIKTCGILACFTLRFACNERSLLKPLVACSQRKKTYFVSHTRLHYSKLWAWNSPSTVATLHCRMSFTSEFVDAIKTPEWSENIGSKNECYQRLKHRMGRCKHGAHFQAVHL